VDARELIFEIVDPQRLRIEALAFDGTLANNIGGASLAIGEQHVSLNFIGAARSLREQALPLNFQAQNPQALGLAVGQPVKDFGHPCTPVVPHEKRRQPNGGLGQDGPREV
jgi:hypothetical protein